MFPSRGSWKSHRGWWKTFKAPYILNPSMLHLDNISFVGFKPHPWQNSTCGNCPQTCGLNQKNYLEHYSSNPLELMLFLFVSFFSSPEMSLRFCLVLKLLVVLLCLLIPNCHRTFGLCLTAQLLSSDSLARKTKFLFVFYVWTHTYTIIQQHREMD